MSHKRPRGLTELEWQQLPIPRRYQVLTWQVNVSFRPPSKSVHMVSSLRDPIENIELLRAGHQPISYPDHLEVWLKHCTSVQSFLEDVTGIQEPF